MNDDVGAPGGEDDADHSGNSSCWTTAKFVEIPGHVLERQRYRKAKVHINSDVVSEGTRHEIEARSQKLGKKSV